MSQGRKLRIQQNLLLQKNPEKIDQGCETLTPNQEIKIFGSIAKNFSNQKNQSYNYYFDANTSSTSRNQYSDNAQFNLFDQKYKKDKDELKQSLKNLQSNSNKNIKQVKHLQKNQYQDSIPSEIINSSINNSKNYANSSHVSRKLIEGYQNSKIGKSQSKHSVLPYQQNELNSKPVTRNMYKVDTSFNAHEIQKKLPAISQSQPTSMKNLDINQIKKQCSFAEFAQNQSKIQKIQKNLEKTKHQKKQQQKQNQKLNIQGLVEEAIGEKIVNNINNSIIDSQRYLNSLQNLDTDRKSVNGGITSKTSLDKNPSLVDFTRFSKNSQIDKNSSKYNSNKRQSMENLQQLQLTPEKKNKKYQNKARGFYTPQQDYYQSQQYFGKKLKSQNQISQESIVENSGEKTNKSHNNKNNKFKQLKINNIDKDLNEKNINENSKLYSKTQRNNLERRISSPKGTQISQFLQRQNSNDSNNMSNTTNSQNNLFQKLRQIKRNNSINIRTLQRSNTLQFVQTQLENTILSSDSRKSTPRNNQSPGKQNIVKSTFSKRSENNKMTPAKSSQKRGKHFFKNNYDFENQGNSIIKLQNESQDIIENTNTFDKSLIGNNFDESRYDISEKFFQKLNLQKATDKNQDATDLYTLTKSKILKKTIEIQVDLGLIELDRVKLKKKIQKNCINNECKQKLKKAPIKQKIPLKDRNNPLLKFDKEQFLKNFKLQEIETSRHDFIEEEEEIKDKYCENLKSSLNQSLATSSNSVLRLQQLSSMKRQSFIHSISEIDHNHEIAMRKKLSNDNESDSDSVESELSQSLTLQQLKSQKSSLNTSQQISNQISQKNSQLNSPPNRGIQKFQKISAELKLPKQFQNLNLNSSGIQQIAANIKQRPKKTQASLQSRLPSIQKNFLTQLKIEVQGQLDNIEIQLEQQKILHHTNKLDDSEIDDETYFTQNHSFKQELIDRSFTEEQITDFFFACIAHIYKFNTTYNFEFFMTVKISKIFFKKLVSIFQNELQKDGFLQDTIDNIVQNINKNCDLMAENSLITEIGQTSGLHKILVNIMCIFQPVYQWHKKLKHVLISHVQRMFFENFFFAFQDDVNGISYQRLIGMVNSHRLLQIDHGDFYQFKWMAFRVLQTMKVNYSTMIKFLLFGERYRYYIVIQQYIIQMFTQHKDLEDKMIQKLDFELYREKHTPAVFKVQKDLQLQFCQQVIKQLVFRRLTYIKLDILVEQIRFSPLQFDKMSEKVAECLKLYSFDSNYIANVKLKLTKLKYRGKVQKSPFEIIGKEQGIENVLKLICEMSQTNRQTVDFLQSHPEEVNHFVYVQPKDLVFPKFSELDNRDFLSSKSKSKLMKMESNENNKYGIITTLLKNQNFNGENESPEKQSLEIQQQLKLQEEKQPDAFDFSKIQKGTKKSALSKFIEQSVQQSIKRKSQIFQDLLQYGDDISQCSQEKNINKKQVSILTFTKEKKDTESIMSSSSQASEFVEQDEQSKDGKQKRVSLFKRKGQEKSTFVKFKDQQKQRNTILNLSPLKNKPIIEDSDDEIQTARKYNQNQQNKDKQGLQLRLDLTKPKEEQISKVETKANQQKQEQNRQSQLQKFAEKSYLKKEHHFFDHGIEMLRIWLHWFLSPEDIYGVEDLEAGIQVYFVAKGVILQYSTLFKEALKVLKYSQEDQEFLYKIVMEQFYRLFTSEEQDHHGITSRGYRQSASNIASQQY